MSQDGSGELEDISCGDPWYEEPDGKNSGFSLIIARTPIGREIVKGAITAGYQFAPFLKESIRGHHIGFHSIAVHHVLRRYIRLIWAAVT
ncbi:Coenzyme F420 hydrogenase/dehydrogenase, beta subunit C-terminal domain [Candidatus Pelagisphaera phototrophica]|nr:Coenzyme F420 hydrogenase/dehydrogenase, beta subunit C-terminal domain [Candidatus Pelagisphaera phototrophica]